MNVYVAILTVVSVLAMVGFFLSLYGRSATLCDAKVGEVYNFEYLQPLNGKPKRWLAKVVEPVVKLDDRAISRLNCNSYRKNDPKFERSHHLVTCETKNGEIRQFYCERTANCRKPIFSNLLAS
jgi:hypothetical protein